VAGERGLSAVQVNLDVAGPLFEGAAKGRQLPIELVCVHGREFFRSAGIFH